MKRLFIMVLVSLAFLLLVSCDDVIAIHDDVFQHALDHLFMEGDDVDHVTTDLFMPTTVEPYPQATLVWTTSKSDIITSEGTVTRPYGQSEDVLIRLKVIVGLRFSTYEITVTVIKADDVVVTFIDRTDTYTITTAEGEIIDPVTLPEQDAFIHIGWKDLETGLEVDFHDPVTSSITVVAIWADKTYDITFDARGGTSVLPILDVIHSMTLPDLQTPTKDGYLFVGWIYVDNHGNEQLLVQGESIINMDIEAFALWVKDLLGEK